MRVFLFIIRLAVFLLLLGFAIRNSDPVTVRYYLGYEWQAPLVFVLLLFFVAGALLGVFAALGVIFRQRRELAVLRRQQAAGAPVVTPPAPGEVSSGV